MSNLVYCSVWILMCFEIFFARNNGLGRLFERHRCIITNIASIVCFWCQLRWFVFPVGFFMYMLVALVSKYLAYHETFGKGKKNNLDWKDVVTFNRFCLSGGDSKVFSLEKNGIEFISFGFRNNWRLQSVCEASYFEKFNHYFEVTMTDHLLWNHIHRVNC